MEVRQKKKKSKVKLRISFILLFCAASLICCFTLYLKENQPESYYDDNDAEIVETVPDNAFLPVPESSARTQRYLRNCIFVGGSTVKALAEHGYIEEENAFYGNISAEEICKAAENSLIQGIYLMPDISSEESFDQDGSDYGKLAEKLSGNDGAKVYISSVIPDIDPANNAADQRINGRLKALAESCGVYYLDMYSELADSSGALPSVYYSDSGLEREACGRISAYILSHTVR